MRKPNKAEVITTVVAAATIAAGALAVEGAKTTNNGSRRSPAIARTPKTDLLPPAGPNPADRSPGTPGPEDASVPVPTGDELNLPVVIVPGQPPKLAFTGPMEITISPFSNDQSSLAKPAVAIGRDLEVVVGDPAPPLPPETR